jgi:hypothetical protein
MVRMDGQRTYISPKMASHEAAKSLLETLRQSRFDAKLELESIELKHA